MINSDALKQIPNVIYPHYRITYFCNLQNCKTFQSQNILDICEQQTKFRIVKSGTNREEKFFNFFVNNSLHILNFYPFYTVGALKGTQGSPLPSFKIDVLSRNRYITFSLSLKSLFQCPL